MEKNILKGQMLINGIDIYEKFGTFLCETKKGGKENLKALMTPPKSKKHIAVSFREDNGERYAKELLTCTEPRDIELTFALTAESKEQWIERNTMFNYLIMYGDKGWLTLTFPTLNNLSLKVFYVSCIQLTPITSLWQEGKQVAKMKIKFREPIPFGME